MSTIELQCYIKNGLVNKTEGTKTTLTLTEAGCDQYQVKLGNQILGFVKVVKGEEPVYHVVAQDFVLDVDQAIEFAIQELKAKL